MGREREKKYIKKGRFSILRAKGGGCSDRKMETDGNRACDGLRKWLIR